jgi:ankyrin repeat protein
LKRFNPDRSYNPLELFLLIEPQYFTLDNLKRVVNILAARYEQTEYLVIVANSSREMLEKEVATHGFAGIPDAIDTPGSKEAARKFYESYRPRAGYFRARFTRQYGGEDLCYSPDPDKEDFVRIVLKSAPDLTYTGSLNAGLLEAAKKGDARKLRELLSQGADVNATDQTGGTALLRVASQPDVEFIKLLLSAGADANKADDIGRTPLMRALLDGSAEGVKVLLERGAIPPNGRSGTAAWYLESAAAFGKNEAIKQLLAWGVEVNARGRGGKTALMTAAEQGQWQTVRLLLSNGARVDARNNNGETALMLAHNEVKTVTALLDAGADVNATNNKGDTALMYTPGRIAVAKARVLIEKGADVNARNKLGQTALSLAFAWDLREELIQLLEKAGAKR